MRVLIPFREEEIECKCGCGKVDFDTLFFHKLLAARYISGISFVIRSWCRCPVHNEAVGGLDDSSHLKGCAADIEAAFSGSRFLIVDALIRAGFTRIGIGKDFVHVDYDTSKAQCVMWLYWPLA